MKFKTAFRQMFLLIFCVAVLQPTQAQNQSPVTTDTIPFHLNSANNIVAQVIVNAKDTLDLMFHTAQNSVSLTEEATKRMTSLQFGDAQESESWGGTGASRYSTKNTLQIGHFSWEDITLWESKHSGKNTDGKFGPSLFQNKVIELNYDSSIMVIHDSLPETSLDYEKLDLVVKHDMLFLNSTNAIDSNKYDNEVLIHSGYGGAILLDDVFTKKHDINNQLEIISESELKDAQGNVLKTKKAILPSFSIGNNHFSDVPVGFFAGAIGRQKMSIMGCEILKRFNILIDLQNAIIYIKPNQLTNTPFGNT